ncbi:START domain-containing protein [Zhongshania sp.]|uniref:START domain-containing protein n=1 Tax=Zhongshania sp. TaxID=1971902 RepID=UPI003565E747
MRRLVGLVVLVLVPIAYGETGGWESIRVENGIEVFSRPVKGVDYRELRGVTELQAPVSEILSFMKDISAIPKINPLIQKVYRLQGTSDATLIYMLMKMPWPVSDRDVIINRSFSEDKKLNSVVIREYATDGLVAVKPGVVRVTSMEQSWSLHAIDECRVTIDFRSLADPAGAIPTSIVNRLSRDAPFTTLKNLKRLVMTRTDRQKSTLCAEKPEWVPTSVNRKNF